MISKRRRYKFFFVKTRGKNTNRLFYPSAKGHRRLKPICLAMNFWGASDVDDQKFTAPPKQAVCWFHFSTSTKKCFNKNFRQNFLFGVEKWNVGNRLKRISPKFEADRSHPRGVNGRSKFWKIFDVEKWNVGDRPKRVLAKFEADRSQVWRQNGRSKFVVDDVGPFSIYYTV